jgi:hypothetical protein
MGRRRVAVQGRLPILPLDLHPEDCGNIAQSLAHAVGRLLRCLPVQPWTLSGSWGNDRALCGSMLTPTRKDLGDPCGPLLSQNATQLHRRNSSGHNSWPVYAMLLSACTTSSNPMKVIDR